MLHPPLVLSNTRQVASRARSRPQLRRAQFDCSCSEVAAFHRRLVQLYSDSCLGLFSVVSILTHASLLVAIVIASIMGRGPVR